MIPNKPDNVPKNPPKEEAKKDYSTAILDKKKAPNRLIVRFSISDAIY